MNMVSNSNNNEKGIEVRTHDNPVADAMSEFMKQGWAPSLLSLYFDKTKPKVTLRPKGLCPII